MIVRSESPEVRIVSSKSCCSGLSGVASSRSAAPSTPFMGVRSSWLTLATNSLRARATSSAASRAAAIRRSVSTRSLMSRAQSV